MINIIFLLTFFSGTDSARSKANQLWICRDSKNGEVYVEFCPINSATDGIYYGHFSTIDGGVVYFKAPIVFKYKDRHEVDFRIDNYTYSDRIISPFEADSSGLFDMDEAKRRGINRAPLLFNGSIINNRLLLKKRMAFIGSQFDRLKFNLIHVD